MLIVEENEEDLPKIGMLLDITNLYGEHSGRLTPWIISLGGAAVPILVYIYMSGWLFIPVWLFAIFEVIFAVRMVMIFPGREKYRKELFKKKLYSKYLVTASLLNINTIHEDGLIEYNNGKVAYIICCFNKTTSDDVRKSIQVRKLLQLLLPYRTFDIKILNLNDSPALKKYYKRAASFNKTDAAKNFVGLVDHMRDLVDKHSNLQCTCYIIYDFKGNWKNLKEAVDVACNSKAARCYKEMFRCNSPEAINEILNRDVDSVVNISELTRHKYATEQYDTSKVIAYDLDEDDIVIQGKAAVDPVIKNKSSLGFHTSLKEKEN